MKEKQCSTTCYASTWYWKNTLKCRKNQYC